MILRARFIVPADGPVIENGAVETWNTGITAVGRASRVDRRDVDYGDAVIVPGLVNAHTHLELGGLCGAIPPGPSLVDWLRRLTDRLFRRPLTYDEVCEAVDGGLRESRAAGVTAIGDITRHPAWTRNVIMEHRFQAVSFGEVTGIGTRRHLLRERLKAATNRLTVSPRERRGISPHAPYSIEPEGIRACVARAVEHGLPLCMHLAESVEEEEFTLRASGPLADFVRGLGIWDENIVPSGCRPVGLAESCGLLGPRTLLAHVNYVRDAEIARLAATGTSVVYCPRTHAAFGHRPHRFRDMLAAGVNVCLGTDSLASNPDLNLWREVCFVHERYPRFDGEELVRMATLRGARALGIDQMTGSITPGKRADLVVLPLPRGSRRWTDVLSQASVPRAVVHGGRPVELALRVCR